MWESKKAETPIQEGYSLWRMQAERGLEKRREDSDAKGFGYWEQDRYKKGRGNKMIEKGIEIKNLVEETYKMRREGKDYYTIKWRNCMVLARHLEKPKIIAKLELMWNEPTDYINRDGQYLTLAQIERYITTRVFDGKVPYRHIYVEMESELVKLDVELMLLLIELAKELGIELVPTKMKGGEVG